MKYNNIEQYSNIEQYNNIEQKIKQIILRLQELMKKNSDYEIIGEEYEKKYKEYIKELNYYTKIKINYLNQNKKSNQQHSLKQQQGTKNNRINSINDVIFYALNHRQIDTKSKAKYFVQQYLKREKKINKTMQEIDVLINKFISKINNKKIIKYDKYCFNKKSFKIRADEQK